MVVKKIPETGKKFLSYEVDGNSLELNDGDTIINLKKRERDDDVHIDYSLDPFGMLINGTDGKYYAAQIDIPARKYTEEKGSDGETTRTAVPFSMDNVTLTLWELND